MKTNRFDEILRRKLENVQPEFQEQDWEKWQTFRQHATPTFWRGYGHWLGYAAATLTTAAMMILYINQSNQNEDLLKEMQALKQQITTQGRAETGVLDSVASGSASSTEVPSIGIRVPHTDTVYMVERRTVYIERPPSEGYQHSKGTPSIPVLKSGKLVDVSKKTVVIDNQPKQDNSSNPSQVPSPATDEIARTNSSASASQYPEDSREKTTFPTLSENRRLSDLKKPIGERSSQGTLPGLVSETEVPMVAANDYDSERLDLGEIEALPTPVYDHSTTNAYRRLKSRMLRPTQTATPEQRLARAEIPAVAKQKAEVPASVQKVEKVAENERLLPDFGLGLPFRVGVAQQWIGPTKALGIWSEVLLGKHWSVQAGLSFQKLENQKFYTDRAFRDKTHEDFRKEHAKPLPPSFDIFNISIATTLTQIPLNLAYRGELGHSFAYFAGVGTDLNLRAKQNLSFDFKLPTNEFGEQRAERNVPFPLINSVNVLAGIEKRWSPIVLQASVLFDNRFKTFPCLSKRTDAGLQVKILYELGSAKKR